MGEHHIGRLDTIQSRPMSCTDQLQSPNLNQDYHQHSGNPVHSYSHTQPVHSSTHSHYFHTANNHLQSSNGHHHHQSYSAGVVTDQRFTFETSHMNQLEPPLAQVSNGCSSVAPPHSACASITDSGYLTPNIVHSTPQTPNTEVCHSQLAQYSSDPQQANSVADTYQHHHQHQSYSAGIVTDQRFTFESSHMTQMEPPSTQMSNGCSSNAQHGACASISDSGYLTPTIVNSTPQTPSTESCQTLTQYNSEPQQTTVNDTYHQHQSYSAGVVADQRFTFEFSHMNQMDPPLTQLSNGCGPAIPHSACAGVTDSGYITPSVIHSTPQTPNTDTCQPVSQYSSDPNYLFCRNN